MDRTLTTRKARARREPRKEEGREGERGTGKAAGTQAAYFSFRGSIKWEKVGAPILPLNTEFLSTQSEDDEKIPLIQKEQLGRICVQFAFLEPRASREGTWGLTRTPVETCAGKVFVCNCELRQIELLLQE